MSEANQQVVASRTRILAIAKDITTVITQDVVSYPDRELQRRFLGLPERADKITDKDLKRLRNEAAELGHTLAESLTAALSSDEIWLKPAHGEEPISGGKDLQAVASVWSVLDTINTRFEKLAERYNMPSEGEAPGYVPPRRFIQRLYLPTLVETYLRELENLRNLQQVAAAEEKAHHKQSLSARWAAAAPGGE